MAMATDFSGRWLCVDIEGPSESLMAKMGARWVIRRMAALAHFGKGRQVRNGGKTGRCGLTDAVAAGEAPCHGRAAHIWLIWYRRYERQGMEAWLRVDRSPFSNSRWCSSFAL